MIQEVLVYSLLANICFSFGSFYFAIYSRAVNPLWLNAFKALMCFIAIALTLIIGQHSFLMNIKGAIFLFISGFVGLCIGDLFMLEAMKILGGSRVVMMFGLTPFYTGVASYYLFGSSLSIQSIFGVLAMISCLFLLSFEKYNSSGHWQLKGILLGALAVFLDNIGLLFTKQTFNLISGLSSFEANFFRTIGALSGFIILNTFYKRINLIAEFKKLKLADRSIVTVASLFGTYLSLFFYLKSVSTGHLSIVSSMAGTGPLFTEIFESIKNKKAPHYLWWMAFSCFGLALFLFSEPNLNLEMFSFIWSIILKPFS